VSVTTPTQTVGYTYGPNGARLKKTTSSGTTLYLGDDIERDTAGAFAVYIDPDVKKTASAISYLYHDYLGSVRRLTDELGAVPVRNPPSTAATQWRLRVQSLRCSSGEN
jgi:hypothetical protein